MHNLDIYDAIQLPHHGQLEDAMAIFQVLKDSYGKEYLVSDNTGSGVASGGSDKLVKYMENECYNAARNTKNGIVYMPGLSVGMTTNTKPQGVKLGDMDIRFW
jgi:hypothetical protein